MPSKRLSKSERFNAEQPDSYKIEYEDRDGRVHQTGSMSYVETHPETHRLEADGAQVIGIVRRDGA